jgi:hypothetical protein
VFPAYIVNESLINHNRIIASGICRGSFDLPDGGGTCIDQTHNQPGDASPVFVHHTTMDQGRIVRYLGHLHLRELTFHFKGVNKVQSRLQTDTQPLTTGMLTAEFLFDPPRLVLQEGSHRYLEIPGRA